MNITISRNDRQIGPYTVWEVNRRLRDGELSPDDMAWQEGAAEWVALKTIPGVGVAATESPSVKPPTVKQKARQKPLIWCGAGLAVLLLIDISVHSGSASIENLTEKTRAYVAELAKSQQATAANVAKASRIRGTVIQVLPNGLFVNSEPYIAVGNSTGNGGGVYIPPDPNGKGRPAEIYGSFFISGHPKQSTLVDDVGIDVDAYQDGVVSYTTAIGARRTVKKYMVVKAFE